MSELGWADGSKKSSDPGAPVKISKWNTPTNIDSWNQIEWKNKQSGGTGWFGVGDMD